MQSLFEQNMLVFFTMALCPLRLFSMSVWSNGNILIWKVFCIPNFKYFFVVQFVKSDFIDGFPTYLLSNLLYFRINIILNLKAYLHCIQQTPMFTFTSYMKSPRAFHPVVCFSPSECHAPQLMKAFLHDSLVCYALS
jgi:hypothetical protein